MNEPNMEEMIKACEAKQTPDEVICYALGTGRIIPKIGWKKRQAEAMDYIKSLEGFIGFHPIDLWHTLIIFDTLNNAKGARNLLKFKKVPVGQVAPILVPKTDIPKGGQDEKSGTER